MCMGFNFFYHLYYHMSMQKAVIFSRMGKQLATYTASAVAISCFSGELTVDEHFMYHH